MTETSSRAESTLMVLSAEPLAASRPGAGERGETRRGGSCVLKSTQRGTEGGRREGGDSVEVTIAAESGRECRPLVASDVGDFVLVGRRGTDDLWREGRGDIQSSLTHACMHTWMYACMHMHTHTRTHTRMHACTHACMHTHTHTRTKVKVCVFNSTLTVTLKLQVDHASPPRGREQIVHFLTTWT